jgi:hypothetical protein
MGEFMCSLFLNLPEHFARALTATSDGKLIYWMDRDLDNLQQRLPVGQMAEVKHMK